MKSVQRPRRQHGFSLIELMIVLAIAAILLAVALPSYRSYLERSRRADGKAALLRAAQWLERSATAAGNYPTALGTGLSASDAAHYQISYTQTNAGNGYTLTATPVVADTGCGKLTLDQAGTRGTTGTASAAECWNR